MPPVLDPLELSIALMRCPSVTPEDAGAQGVLVDALTPFGFTCETFTGEEADKAPVKNLYARAGTTGPLFCFAGHTDVVPPGDLSAWQSPPFAPEVRDGILYGRGAVDMKAAIAAFCCAATAYRTEHPEVNGSVGLLITGDEEGEAVNGTRKLLEWLKDRSEIPSACIVGEPTNPEQLGEMAKIGRRGSVSFAIDLHGIQGHVAYPHFADNPVSRLTRILHALDTHALDDGTPYFQPSNLEITSFDVNNPADNVIPGKARATFNIRFNDLHSSAILIRWVRGICGSVCEDSKATYTLQTRVSGEAFLTQPGSFSDIVSAAVHAVTGRRPELSTTGGTSDARFIKDYCPVVEFGLTNKTAHQVNECVSTADICALTQIYKDILIRYFTQAT